MLVAEEPTQLPLILTHGWPDSGHRVPRTDRAADQSARARRQPGDAFHVMIPSMPVRLLRAHTQPGWDTKPDGRAWLELMTRSWATTATAPGATTVSQISPEVGRTAPTAWPACTSPRCSHSRQATRPSSRTCRRRTYVMGKLQWFMENKGGPRVQRLPIGPAADDGPRAADSPAGPGWPGPASCSNLTTDYILANVAVYWFTGTTARWSAATTRTPRGSSSSTGADHGADWSGRSPRTSDDPKNSPSVTTATSCAGPDTTAGATSRRTTPPTCC